MIGQPGRKAPSKARTRFSLSLREGAINEAYRNTPSWSLIVKLRMDPFEVGPDAALYMRDFYADQMWIFVPAQA